MRDKKNEVDATLREIPAYTLGEFPIFRWEHRLDDFQTGELNRHWHSEFLFGLVILWLVNRLFRMDETDY